MAITYVVDPESGTVRTRCAGDVSLEEVLSHFSQLESDASLPARLDVLLDLTPMESLPESDQLRSVASEMERLKSRVAWGRIAIVADRDALYGMTRMFQVFAEGVSASSHVFRKLEEAETWLGSRRSPAADPGA